MKHIYGIEIQNHKQIDQQAKASLLRSNNVVQTLLLLQLLLLSLLLLHALLLVERLRLLPLIEQLVSMLLSLPLLLQ